MSGAIDIVVVRQQDGTFRCSPFYVRFGKYRGLFSRKERTVFLSVNGVQVEMTMRLSHSGEAYFVDPVASTGTPAIDTDVFSDPVGANGYSSGEDQANRDILESDGSRQRWYQRNLFSNWRSKSPAPSPGPAKSALSEQLQCSSSDSAVVAVPPLAAAVADLAPSASAPEPSTLLDVGPDIGLDIGDQGTSVAGVGNRSGHLLGATPPTAIPDRTGPASVGAEDSGYSPDADATPTGAEPGASFPTEEALKAAPKEAVPSYSLSVASEVTDVSVEDSEADSEAESERGVSG
eukprot:CAMPEP_0198222862 /NCGR_PEP_ID=MMETSP1445-20131203/90028_1 /TAXON_ID=36898 /ORGANISM="Pyramimonas sp., Strain CCMP2087" /LENGTH=290 /DNA_ID=CAMNT_0043901523 /DNA_START=393 /DNA_END=1261 /DNA_ORIENTATION=+